MAAILPSIRNLSGVLHMEDFTPSTENIIFEKDLTEAEQQTQEEAAQQRMEEQAQEDGESETGEAGADAQSGEDAEPDGSGTETQDDDSGAGSEADGVSKPLYQVLCGYIVPRQNARKHCGIFRGADDMENN